MASETASPNPGEASAVAKGSVPSAPVALAPPLVESKRTKLIHSIEVARDAGASHAVISALQADLDSLPEPKVGQDEMDQGRLLQLRAKQQAHYQSELDALNQELSAVQLQIEVLTSKASQLQETAKTMASQHQSNLATIDQAIAKVDPLLVAHPSRDGSGQEGIALSAPSFAQVLSETLGTAVNDSSFFTNVSPEHQAAIKQFCSKVTSHFATNSSSVSSASRFASGLPSPVCTTSSTSMPVVSDMEGIEDSMPADNHRSFVGISG